MCHSLSTDSFLCALLRFICTRGHSTRQIWSDNATNFVGADNEISRAVQEIDERRIVNSLSRRGVEWKYSPARSPHQSGLWEVMIRETKDTNLARNQWSRARVRKVFPDRDGVVRRVEVMVPNRKCFIRDVRYVCPLEAHI